MVLGVGLVLALVWFARGFGGLGAIYGLACDLACWMGCDSDLVVWWLHGCCPGICLWVLSCGWCGVEFSCRLPVYCVGFMGCCF